MTGVDDDEWFSLRELTERLGALVWVETQLGEVLTAWSKVERVVPVALAFSTAAGHHRWHSEIVRTCLPTSPLLAPDDAVVAPTDGWQRSVETMTGLLDPDATVARLRLMVRVVEPWLRREIGALVDLAQPVSDAPMIRWLRFVSLDHDQDGEVLEQLLAWRSDDPVRFEDHALVNSLDLR